MASLLLGSNRGHSSSLLEIWLAMCAPITPLGRRHGEAGMKPSCSVPLPAASRVDERRLWVAVAGTEA